MTNQNRQLVMNALSEKKLLIRYRNGDEEAFHEVVNLYSNTLYSFLRRLVNHQEVIEKVFQETFLQLYTHHYSYDPNYPLKAWLYAIAANKVKNIQKKSQPRPVMTYLNY